MPTNNQLLVSAQALTISISVSGTASASVALPNRGETLRIVNDGTATAFISVGAGTQTAVVPSTTPVATGVPVLNTSDVSLRIPAQDGLQISAITASGTTTLRIQVSEGT